MDYSDDEVAAELACGLVEVARACRDSVRSDRNLGGGDDHAVVRIEGGDEVFGVDDRADAALLRGFCDLIGPRWSGELVMEGHDDPLVVGDGRGPWCFLVDPLDGTRPYLANKRSAWVLIGAGRNATTLDDLELGVAVEVPVERSDWGMVAWADTDGHVKAWDEDLSGQNRDSKPIDLTPRKSGEIDRTFVTISRFAPGTKALIGTWEDRVLEGFEVYEDPWLCTGGLLMGLATGSDSAVLDPRPIVVPGTMAAHPYDLAAIVVARAAGVIVEALPPGPLRAPLNPRADVAWAGYANGEIAEKLRARLGHSPSHPGALSSK